MFFTQKLSLKFRPGLTKERVDLHEIAHYRSNVGETRKKKNFWKNLTVTSVTLGALTLTT